MTPCIRCIESKGPEKALSFVSLSNLLLSSLRVQSDNNSSPAGMFSSKCEQLSNNKSTTSRVFVQTKENFYLKQKET